MDNASKSIEGVLDDVVKTEQRDRQALGILLDRQNRKKNHIFALKAKMGDTSSYVSVVTLEWVALKVRYAKDLPIFKGKLDRENKVPIDEETVSEIRQREPDWRRQIQMTLYLVKRSHHKFPPILVVAHQNWVDNPNADEWAEDDRATRNSINERALDTEGDYFDLGTGETTLFYALDGQHRLMAIQGLHTLLTEGKLYTRTIHGKRGSRVETTDELVKGDNHQLQSLMAEKIGIEIIPAVLKGETVEEALRRLRSIFVHVNQNAKRLEKGELILLDEDYGFSIVARRVAVKHKMLKVNDRVKMKGGQLSDKEHYYTTIETIAKIAEEYLGQLDYAKWKTLYEGMAIRPADEELDSATDKLCAYFDALSQLPSHQAILQGAGGEEIIRWKKGEDNILFRPLAQMALARAMGTLEKERECAVNQVAAVLAKQEKAGQLKLNDPKTPWFGVLMDPIEKVMRRKETYKDLCANLLIHLLGGGTPAEKERAELKRKFSESRVVSDVGGDLENRRAMNLKGKPVSLDKMDLPTPWE